MPELTDDLAAAKAIAEAWRDEYRQMLARAQRYMDECARLERDLKAARQEVHRLRDVVHNVRVLARSAVQFDDLLREAYDLVDPHRRRIR